MQEQLYYSEVFNTMYVHTVGTTGFCSVVSTEDDYGKRQWLVTLNNVDIYTIDDAIRAGLEYIGEV
jgi:hypothetical protein